MDARQIRSSARRPRAGSLPKRTPRLRCRERGVAIAETVIALPILLALILGIIQFALIYEAKATLNHATLLAARAGAVEHAQPQAILSGLARGLVPLYSPESSFQGYQSTLARVSAAVAGDARVRILNPTQEAFADFSEEVEGVREIPNDRLHVRSTAVGTQSGLNIQDANLLRVQVMYGYELNVPLVNWFITRTLLAFDGDDGYDAFERQLLRRTRLPILSTSTVRMHTPARMSDLVVSRGDLPDIQRFDAGSAPPDIEDESGEEDEDEQEEEGESGEESEHGGSTLADGFLGFGSGSGSTSTEPGGGTNSGGGDDDWIVGGGGPSDCAINTCCSPPRTPI
jgi:Flp pilus assembly protein TadG